MSATRAAERPLIAERGATFGIDAFVVDFVWLGGWLVIAGGDGGLRFVDRAGLAGGPGAGPDARQGAGPSAVMAHAGAILCAAEHPDADSVLTGGDDGRLVRTWPSGRSEEIAAFGSRWVEHVVSAKASRLIACAAGRKVHVLGPGGSAPTHAFAHPSTVAGLALDRKGRRLAASRYGGVSLCWPLAPGSPAQELPWRGSHLGVTWSPDGRFVVSTMQENALHGWRIGDGASMHMQGYPTKTRSLAWGQKGRWLATAGADRVVCWPFTGKSGPMDKQPVELGPGGLLVTHVACHPGEDAIAAGYADGSALLLRLADDRGAVVQVSTGTAISALRWSADGDAVAIGHEDGRVGVLPLSSTRAP